MAKDITIKGRKGGSSSSRTPTEQPDDLQSVATAKILLALGEGEFGGELTAQDIYLDGTALENADGSQNFSGVTWEFRSGTQDQTYIQGIPGTENEINVGVNLTSDSPWVHTVSNTQLSAIRFRLKWPGLFQQEDDGDLVGYSIAYAIDLQTDGGSYSTVINTTVTGKTTTGYERSHRVNLPPGASTWTLRVRKLTAEANSAKVGDTMTLETYTEVIDAKFRYPNTALLYIEFDSSQFSGNIPQITCEPKGRVIRVPDNYDPETRSYSGQWGGLFKWAWTDNPAWVFYDIIVSDRFGLGDRVTAANVDKWTLYQVAQYCDELISDGKGGSGTEPRFKCDVYVQTRNDAYSVLRDFAAIFRGMTYWGGNQLVALADMPRDVDYNFTNANVTEGIFTYSSSNTKNRYTSALVSYSDPANGYADAVEPVFEAELVSRYKVYNQLEVTAIGCTRQSEANRKGRWGILTNNKDRVVTFSVGLDGDIPQPGYVIAIADQYLSGVVAGGRISSVTNERTFILDREPTAAQGDFLQLNLPSGISQSRTIASVSGKVVTVTASFSELPQAESVWVVESSELFAQQYRVTGVSLSDDDSGKITISGIAYNPDKFQAIDNGTMIDERPISVIPAGSQGAPSNIVIDSYSVVNQGISIETMHVTWDAIQGAISYEAQWRRNEGNWINIPRSSTTSFEVPNIYTGRYLVRVRAINAAEISSGWGYSDEVELTGKVGNPGKPVGFTASDDVVFGIVLSWTFPDNSADTLKTQIQYSLTPGEDESYFLGDIAYPSHTYQQMGLRAGQSFYYRAQLVDKTGNESGYTDWVLGVASTNVEDIIDLIDEGIRDTDAFNELTEQLSDTGLAVTNNAIAALENALANNETVNRQYAQYGSTRAEIATINTVLADQDQAIASVGQQITAVKDDFSAQISQVSEVVTNHDNAISSINTELDSTTQTISDINGDIDGINGDIDGINGDISGINGDIDGINGNIKTINANIQTAQSAITDTKSAVTSLETQLTAKINDVSAVANQKLTASFTDNGTGSASYRVQVGITRSGTYYSSGMAVGIESSGSTYKSTVVFNADQFGIYTGSNPAAHSLAFTVSSGQVFINQAFIQDGTITNAKIGSFIQSSNYVSGSAGWRLDKTGTLQINGVGGGGRMLITSTLISIYDSSNTLRLRMGLW